METLQPTAGGSPGAAGARSARGKQIPLRLALVALVAIALLPAFALIQLLLFSVRSERQSAIAGRGHEVSALAAHIIERAIGERLLLRTLAYSQSLLEGRLQRYHTYTSRIAKREGIELTLNSPSGDVILSTAIPYGEPPPAPGDRATVKDAWESGEVQTSSRFRSPLTGRDVLSVVLRSDTGDHVLSTTFPTEYIGHMLNDFAPRGWLLVLVDGEKRVISQGGTDSRQIAQHLPHFLSRMIGDDQTPITVGSSGEEVSAFWKHSGHGWKVLAVAENANIATNANASLYYIPTMALLILGTGLVAAFLSAMLLELPLRRLSSAAAAIGRGDDAPQIRSGLREVDAVGTALETAGRLRKSAEEGRAGLLDKVARQKLLFEGVFRTSPDGIVVTDVNRRILEVNPAALRIFGYEAEELKGQLSRVFFADTTPWEGLADRVASSASFLHFEFDALRKDGSSFAAKAVSTYLLDRNGAHMGYLAVMRDAEMEQSREAALAQRQQLETLGRLTGGIAHDFNNLLTVVSGHLQLLEASRLDERQNVRVGAALNAVQMGARLNQRLMTFARQRDLTSSRTEMNELVLSLMDLLEKAVGEHIQVEVALHTEPLWISIDRSELENALLNLSLNARDAMPEAGTLRFETDLCILDAQAATAMGGLQPGRYVRLTAVDTGIGMPPTVVARAFEPFFTTKPVGKGSGLGLSTIHGFVRQSNGHIWIDSKLKEGTRINILLPALEPAANEDPDRGDTARVFARGSGECILLVEDNPAVAALTRDRLAMLGYRVVMAHNALAALKIIEGGEKIDLLFTDVVMPGGMSGYQLADRCAQLLPHAGILLTSGFPEAAGRNETSRRYARLDKPYEQSALADAVRDVLEARPRPQPTALAS